MGMLTGRDRDLHATALAVTQLHIGKQKEMEQLQLQHTRARILADGYVTAGGVHSWTTVTPCPQCDVNVTTTRLMQHGEHQNRQACHVCVCAPPPDHNADTVVPGLGQVRWDDRTKTMYTDVDGGSNLMYWNKQDPTWHRVDRASNGVTPEPSPYALPVNLWMAPREVTSPVWGGVTDQTFLGPDGFGSCRVGSGTRARVQSGLSQTSGRSAALTKLPNP